MRRLIALDRDGTVIEERPYLSDPAQVKQDLAFVKAQILSIQQRIKDEPGQKAAWEQTLKQFEGRRKDLEKSTQAPVDGRSLLQTIVTLDTGVSDNEAWNKRVRAFVAKWGPTNQ